MLDEIEARPIRFKLLKIDKMLENIKTAKWTKKGQHFKNLLEF